MKRLLFLTLLLGYPGLLLSEEKTNVFAELDVEIESQLSSDAWHPAARTFIGTQWAEYKEAHKKPGQRGDFHGARCYGGFLCDPTIEKIEPYAGAYIFKPSANSELPPGPHLQIEVSSEHRVFVIEEGRRIPAVVNNNIIFFTRGELVQQNAQLGSKAYAQLEMSMLYKARYFGLVTGPADSYADDMLRLVEYEEKVE